MKLTSISQISAQLLQRLSCRFKKNVYFIHTSAILPTIMLLPQTKKIIFKTLLNRLISSSNYQLSNILQEYKLSATTQKHNTQSQSATQTYNKVTSLHGIHFDINTKFIILQNNGNLTLGREQCEGEILAVLLFCPKQQLKVNYMHSSLNQNVILLLKITTLIALWRLQGALFISTRVENHPN